MKGKRNVFRMITAGVLTAALLAGPAQAADPEIRVGSYKGNTLSVGERSALIIGPAGAEYTASSSDPEVVTVEQVLTFWVAVAKAEGPATITVTNDNGDTGQLDLTVGKATPSAEPDLTVGKTVAPDGLDLTANMENGHHYSVHPGAAGVIGSAESPIGRKHLAGADQAACPDTGANRVFYPQVQEHQHRGRGRTSTAD